ncbi:hypothetical protein RRG08_033206 [Elysia crispata]|uniref:Uncharacterized protein n=1 Tax=Elysia crispata TaxID=231223 RepID=A0AAE1ED49_9GAST|nr:hypothetical protein RRG08_033206 [Elysia crispata]
MDNSYLVSCGQVSAFCDHRGSGHIGFQSRVLHPATSTCRPLVSATRPLFRAINTESSAWLSPPRLIPANLLFSIRFIIDF